MSAPPGSALRLSSIVEESSAYKSPRTNPLDEDHPLGEDPSSAETKTICPSSMKPEEDEADGSKTEDAMVDNIAIVAGSKPLWERLPSIDDVMKEVRVDYSINEFLKSSKYFNSETAQDRVFNSPMWEEAAELVFESIVRYTPRSERDIPKVSRRYEARKQRIIEKYIVHYDIECDAAADEDAGAGDKAAETRDDESAKSSEVQDGDAIDGATNAIAMKEKEAEKRFEYQALAYLIGMEFMKWYQRKITPPTGQERVEIAEQVEKVVRESIDKDVESFFDELVGQRAYYITGFFCSAGQKEADRRTQKNKVGACIKSISQHFVTRKEKDLLRQIKCDLPDGVTAVVDERNQMDGLKYPNLKLYSAFALIEKVYSSLATPGNFMTFGGRLLDSICEEVMDNETIYDIFFDLFDSSKFSDDEMKQAMQYYIKVFGNCRAKDVCYRYNSNITQGDTVGLRQTLKAGGKLKDIKAGHLNSKQFANLSTKLTRVRVRVSKKLQRKQLQARLPSEYKKENQLGVKYESEREDDDGDAEGELPAEDEHAELMELAHQDIDEGEEYQKSCTINADDDEYMGKCLGMIDHIN